MREIGGFFELECYRQPPYYQDGIYLNACRSALRYIIRVLGVKRIYVPIYTCNVVRDAIEQEGCKSISYNLDASLLPAIEFPTDEFIIYNNYFGVMGHNVKIMTSRYSNLIVDNAQAFYSNLTGRAAIYSPRKFFGLPDGGILRGKDIPKIDFPQGQSSEVVSHLFKRYDYGAEDAYKDFCQNDKALEKYSIQKMSRLTESLMGNIDYNFVREKRLANFNYLLNKIPTLFPISMNSDDVPLVYPLLIDKGDKLRTKLIEHKVFCARYWPNVIDDIKCMDVEKDISLNLVAIPIDQRYGLDEMSRIVNLITALIDKC